MASQWLMKVKEEGEAENRGSYSTQSSTDDNVHIKQEGAKQSRLHNTSQPRNENAAGIQAVKSVFECIWCSTAFSAPDQLRQHMQIHIQETEVKCPVCDETFLYRSMLRKHMKFHEEKKFKCALCTSSYFEVNALKVHICNKHSLEAEEKERQKKKRKKTEEADSEVGNHETDFECVWCNLSFFKREELFQHVQLHINENHVQCSHCGETFASKWYLRKHVQNHRSNMSMNFKCKYCPAAFSKPIDLNTHIKNKHPGNEELTYGEMRKLKKAEELQDEEEEEKAGGEECSEETGEGDLNQPVGVFNQNEHDSHHMIMDPITVKEECEESKSNEVIDDAVFSSRKRKETTEDEGGSCSGENIVVVKEMKACQSRSGGMQDQVGLGTYVGRGMEEGKSTHSLKKGFECVWCETLFPQREELREHMKLHIQETQVKCGVCGETFLYQSSLNKHMKYHKKKAFMCDLCDASYFDRYSLTQHQQRKHSNF